MLCHRCGRFPAGGAVMPWPLMPSLAHSPGELLLDVAAARILTAIAPISQHNPAEPTTADASLRAFVGDGPSHIVAALHAADMLPPDSSPGCAPSSVSPATASPRRPPETCRTGGTAC